MRANRIAMMALLLGIVSGMAYGQPDPYHGQPDNGYAGEAAPTVDVGFFYNELSPYGEWVRHPQYGWSWFPRHVPAGWRPYSLGHWVESDYGWTWASDEPFGWATYHYGRWAWDPELGWLWVPGTDWGPAWVAWQQGNGYVGWAPLPPAVGFDFGVGIRLGGLSLSFGLAPRDYAFVEERRFLDSRVGGYIVPEARNITIIHNTTNITNYTVVNNQVINHGVPIERIEQATGRRAPRFRVATVTNPRGAGVQRDVINVYRPAENRLATVAVARRNNAGLPQAAPLPIRQPVAPAPPVKQPAARSVRPAIAPVPIPVAPRTPLAPQVVKESQFVKEQRDLKANQDKQQKALDQIHRQELAQAQAKKVNAQEVAQQHAAELQALQDQRQRTAQQLQTRQQIQRQAVQATAANVKQLPKPLAKSPAKPETPKNDKKNDAPKPPGSF